jgi:two-component system NtrC family sensor kinase
MSASIAHELSNPLATIIASTQAILSVWPRSGSAGVPSGGREGGNLPPEFLGQGVPLRQLREDLELILEEARRAGEIVHGLLASARQDPPEWRICSVADVVRRAVALSRHHLKLHNISLQAPYFDPHEGYPLWSRVRGDSNQLQQVLLNLIINAQQAISAHRGYGAVRVTLAADGPERVVLTIEDDGPGVPEPDRELIFRPFFTTKPAGQGTGLGLSISSEIIRAHGGTIRAESSARGAVFRLELPSLAASDRARQGGVAPSDATVVQELLRKDPELARTDDRAPRVLLVDDEEGIRRSVGRFLRQHGYQVSDVPSAEAALHALQSGRYHAVISDLRMPGLSREEFFARLRREFPEVVEHLIFTSGDTGSEETRAFLAECGRPALQKPYELTELLRILAALCPTPNGLQTRVSA